MYTCILCTCGMYVLNVSIECTICVSIDVCIIFEKQGVQGYDISSKNFHRVFSSERCLPKVVHQEKKFYQNFPLKPIFHLST